jgi:ABC-type amino acid transport substrate-binding protein
VSIRVNEPDVSQTYSKPVGITSFVLTAALLLLAYTYPAPIYDDQDDPRKYFGKPLRIGITGALPGWSRGPSEGFDVALAKFIANHYKTPWEPVQIFEQDRMLLLEENKADLIIATFTITEERSRRVDFAGPYYIDTVGVWMNRDKADISPKEAQLCQAGSTTGVGAAGRFEREYKGEKFSGIKTETLIASCLDRFRLKDDPTVYVATDWSIIRASEPNAKLVDGNEYISSKYDQEGNTLDPGPPPEGNGLRSNDRQYYGVAMRNNLPEVCADLTGVINNFLNSNEGFGEAYSGNLQKLLGPVKNDWHKPLRADSPGTEGSYSCK